MESRIGEVLIHYVEHGDGVPIVALHGGGVDHRELEAAMEAVLPSDGYRRIYPDLPGMGRTTADGLTGNADVVDLLSAFIEHLAVEPVLLIGHSYGAYLARGLAAKRRELLRGLALICPLGDAAGDVAEHHVVIQDADAYDELDPEHREGFDEYFVVRTAATARRYRDHVVPGTELVDEAALEPIVGGWSIDLGSQPFDAPTLIVAGRHDSTVGYSDAMGLLEHYPHATLAVLENAGHALIHECPEILGALVRDWFDRERASDG